VEAVLDPEALLRDGALPIPLQPVVTLAAALRGGMRAFDLARRGRGLSLGGSVPERPASVLTGPKLMMAEPA
jgi:hypothetical protein